MCHQIVTARALWTYSWSHGLVSNFLGGVCTPNEYVEQQLQHHPQPALTVPVLTEQVQQAWNSIRQNNITCMTEYMHVCRLAVKSLDVTLAVNVTAPLMC